MLSHLPFAFAYRNSFAPARPTKKGVRIRAATATAASGCKRSSDCTGIRLSQWAERRVVRYDYFITRKFDFATQEQTTKEPIEYKLEIAFSFSLQRKRKWFSLLKFHFGSVWSVRSVCSGGSVDPKRQCAISNCRERKKNNTIVWDNENYDILILIRDGEAAEEEIIVNLDWIAEFHREHY